ncbi:MAG: OB-fold domain-containing protein [Dehalococcoidia bacterium]|nr:OB-fold domain-containing protein [Dehalococcoidia bacterium]
MPKPIPVPDEVSKPFWDAVNEKRLVLQNCTSCNRMQYPPERTCGKCGSADHLEWRGVEGQGHILEYLVTYDSRIRRKQVDQPYNLVLITLDEDPNINFLSNLPGTPVDEVPVGAPVEVVYEEVAPGQLIQEWRVVG